MAASLDNVPPMSSASRQQFQQYLARLASTTSAATDKSDDSSASSAANVDVLVQRSAQLASRVDALHAQIIGRNTCSADNDDVRLFWSTLALLTNLRAAASQLEQQTSSGKDAKQTELALARTRQDVEIVQSLLKTLSVSSQAESADVFTAAPLSPRSCTVSFANACTTEKQDGYEYWKQRTLSSIHTDHDESSPCTSDDDAASSSSVFTEPDLDPTPPKLAALNPDHSRDTQDYSEYSLASHRSTSSPPAPAPGPEPPAPPHPSTTTASDTILQSDRASHEALSSELLRMASILKTNSLAFADSLERDRLLLEKAASDLGQNLDLMTRTRGRLGVYSKKARSMGWFTLSAILIVIISWMLMFLLIRLT